MLAAIATLGLPARAQDTPPEGLYVRPGYALGQLRVFPTVAIENTYNDNIFADANGKDSDHVVSFIPRVSLETSWSRHSLSANAFGRINRYTDHHEEDNDEYGVEARGRLDLANESALGAIFSQGRRTVSRADSENTGRTDPQQLDYLEGRLRYDHSFARLDLGLRGSVANLNFLDKQDADRDRIAFAVSSRLAHRLSSGFSVFLEPDVKILVYEESVDIDLLKQDRVTLGGFAGSSFDVSTLKGEVSIGVVHTNFDEASFADVTTLGVRSEVTWEASSLTRVRVELERIVIPTGVNDTTGKVASSKVRTLASLEARHELFRSLILRAKATYFREDFKQIRRTDDNFRVRAGAEYRINRFFSITARYDYRERATNEKPFDKNRDRDRDFRRHVTMLTIDIRL